jgi:hypothetical protein
VQLDANLVVHQQLRQTVVLVGRVVANVLQLVQEEDQV